MKINIGEIKKILNEWYYLVGIVLLFTPGTLYLIKEWGIDIKIYQGTAIIPFLIMAFYYSIPFFFLGLFAIILTKILENKSNPLNIKDFVVLTFIGLLFYSATSVLNRFVKINDFAPLIGNFWGIYFLVLAIILMIFILVVLIKTLKKKKEN